MLAAVVPSVNGKWEVKEVKSTVRKCAMVNEFKARC
jgi:hypothetical protein